MRALFIQHDPFSPTGPVGEAFADLGYEISEFLVVPHADFHSPNVVAEWPNFSDYDLLVPMGSPWGAWDEAKIGSWLLPELALLKAAHESDIPIFGICFGGQLMARALGGSVAPGPRPEIGWFPVHSDRPDLIAEGPWFQFHYDRWTLPPNIKEIARTPVASQGFVSERTLGIQFHPEVVTSTLQGWIDNGGENAVAGDGQSIEALINMTRAQEVAAIGRAHTLVKNFVSQVVMA